MTHRFEEVLEITSLVMRKCACRRTPELRRVNTIRDGAKKTSEFYVRCISDCPRSPGMLYRDTQKQAVDEWNKIFREER